MAKRIHDLSKPEPSAVKSDMYLVVDQLETGGGGTYASRVKHVIGSVIGKSATGADGGESLNQIADTGEIVLNHTINIPAQSTRAGGQVNLFIPDDSQARVDAVLDKDGEYKHNGETLGKN